MKWSYSRVIEAVHLDDVNSVANECLVGFLFAALGYFFWYHAVWPVAILMFVPAAFALGRLILYLVSLAVRKLGGR